MRFEAAFIACYATVLLGVAAGLHRLGKIDTSPWRSRVLAGHRRQVPGSPPGTAAGDAGPAGDDEGAGGAGDVVSAAGAGEPAGWPHSEAGRLHTLIGSVALAAALTLTVVGLVRHHRPVEALVLGATAVAAGTGLVRLTRPAPPSRTRRS